jgi:hypothetical protein
MSYPGSLGGAVSVIPQTQLPDNWYSDPEPESDAIFVKVITTRKKTKWFYIEFFGEIYEVHEDPNQETMTPADVRKLTTPVK